MRRSLIVLAVVALAGGAARGADFPYENIGMGGAGGIFTPASSPVDPKFLLCSCDMSGCYRSDDMGKSWRMINFTQINGAKSSKPGFHPKNVNIVVWKDRISTDKGWTWKPVSQQKPWGRNVTHCAVTGDGRLAIYIGGSGGLWGSHDSGSTWKKYASGACGGITILPDGTAFAAAGSSLYRWKAGSSEPARIDTPGVSGAIKALGAGGTGESHTIHLLTSSVYTSTDSGATWKQTKSGGGLHDLVMATNQTAVAYVCDKNLLHKTTNSGASWDSVFKYRQNVDRSWVDVESKWGYYIVAKGINVCPSNANVVMVTTQAEFFLSTDGGKSWAHKCNERVGNAPDGARGGRYRPIGLEVTTTWDYLFDPHEPNRHYIAYSDIGFARSVDGGNTWSKGNWGSPWGNTYYYVVFDPFQKGKMYAATSRIHDIPHWMYSAPRYGQGGVCISEDHAANWKPVMNGGLPVRQCCGIAVDKKASKPGAVVLYVTVYGDGVYKSVDSGKSWKKKPGAGRSGNYHVYQVSVHEKTGWVYVNTTGNRSGTRFSPNGGLWRSKDGGDSWTELTQSLPLGWPNGFAIHPDNPELIYLTAGTYPGPGGNQGGVYKTTDGGRSWKHILKNSDCPGYVQGMFITMHRDDPNVLYFGGTRGLYASPDGGNSWKHMTAIPFSLVHRVRVDPSDKCKMYVTGFGGGVWRGPTVRGLANEKTYVPSAPRPAAGASTSRTRTRTRPVSKPAAPAGPTDEDRASAKTAEAKLRKAVIDGVAGGKKASIYIDFMGRTTRAKLLGADDAGVRVRASGMETVIKWDKLSPRRLYGIAKKYTEDHLLLGTYCHGMGLKEEAQQEGLRR